MKKIIGLLALSVSIGACKNAPKEADTTAENTTISMEMEDSQQWTDLFNGKDFSGWHAYNGNEVPNAWQIEEGAMVYKPREKMEGENLNIVTDQTYENFELSIEWRVSEGANSGIFWGVVEDPKLSEPYLSGPEIQVLDNERHPDSFVGAGTHKAGSLYDMIAPTSEPNPAGEWNHFIIHVNHKTNEGFVLLNGTEVTRFPVHGPDWDAMKAKSKFADWESFGTTWNGKLGLQDHGNEVAFRNIKVRPL
jgi:hypothetical protein